MKSIEDVKKRVQALFARAESTPYENERNLCIEQAYRLMAKYSIDSAIRAESEKNASVPGNFQFEMHGTYTKMRGILWDEVCMVFNCKLIQESQGLFRMFGFESDIDVAWELSNYVDQQVLDKLSTMSESARFKLNYILGFVSTVVPRIKQFYLEEAKQFGTGTDLILANRKERSSQAADDFYGEGGLIHGKNEYAIDPQARNLGREDGLVADIKLTHDEIEN